METAVDWEPGGWVPRPAPPLRSSVTQGGELHVSEVLLAPLKNDTVGQHGLQSPLQF